MTIKDLIYEEIKNSECDYILDISLKSAKNLSAEERRKIIFELEAEGKIILRHTKQMADKDFPLVIIGWEY